MNRGINLLSILVHRLRRAECPVSSHTRGVGYDSVTAPTAETDGAEGWTDDGAVGMRGWFY